MIVKAQSELIISENFQTWEATEDTDDSKCSAGVTIQNENTGTLEILTEDGVKEIQVTLIKCAIAPECESRRVEDSGTPPTVDNLEGITTGWVMLNKLSDGKVETYTESLDTIGEFIFGPVPHIDSIRIGHSATGGNRGFRIYTSYDGIEWQRPTENEFWDGADCQRGDVNTVEIYESDIYIKITSGFKRSDSTSQYTRIHNIDVWGIPGVLTSNDVVAENEMLSVYPNPAKGVIKVDVADELANGKLQIIDVLGKTVYNCMLNQQKSTIDISKLHSGNYFVQVSNNKKTSVKQLIIK